MFLRIKKYCQDRAADSSRSYQRKGCIDGISTALIRITGRLVLKKTLFSALALSKL